MVLQCYGNLHGSLLYVNKAYYILKKKKNNNEKNLAGVIDVKKNIY